MRKEQVSVWVWEGAGSRRIAFHRGRIDVAPRRFLSEWASPYKSTVYQHLSHSFLKENSLPVPQCATHSQASFTARLVCLFLQRPSFFQLTAFLTRGVVLRRAMSLLIPQSHLETIIKRGLRAVQSGMVVKLNRDLFCVYSVIFCNSRCPILRDWHP